MANSVTTQILEQGDRNVVQKVIGILDTSDLAVTTLLDISTLAPNTVGDPVTQVRIDRVDFSVAEGMSVIVWWDATTDVPADTYVQAEHSKYYYMGGLQNNGGVGKTGNVNISTAGWATGTKTFDLVIHYVKQY